MYGVKITVADVDALAVMRLVPDAEITDRGEILPAHPRVRELAGRKALPQKNIREGVADHCARLGEQKNIADAGHRAEVDHAGCVQDEKETRIFFFHAMDIADLGFCEKEVALDRVAVAALTAGAAEHVDSRIAFALNGKNIFRLRHDSTHAVKNGRQMFGSCPAAYFPGEALPRGADDVIIIIQPCPGRDGKARVPKAFLDRYHVMGMDIA